MKYYGLNDDIQYPKRWYLGDVLNVDNWDFLTSRCEYDKNLEMEIYRDGMEMDFTFSVVYGVPIVSHKVKEVLYDCTDILFFPVRINRVCKNNYYIMVITKFIDCTDESRSIFQKFEINDPVRPDMAGSYRGFIDLKVDPDKITVDILRLEKFEIQIIVSEKIKNKLISANVSGIELIEVT